MRGLSKTISYSVIGLAAALFMTGCMNGIRRFTLKIVEVRVVNASDGEDKAWPRGTEVSVTLDGEQTGWTTIGNPDERPGLVKFYFASTEAEHKIKVSGDTIFRVIEEDDGKGDGGKIAFCGNFTPTSEVVTVPMVDDSELVDNTQAFTIPVYYEGEWIQCDPITHRVNI